MQFAIFFLCSKSSNAIWWLRYLLLSSISDSLLINVGALYYRISNFLQLTNIRYWAVQVFQSYGWTFIPILLSILISSGLKAFLMALALPVGQSVLTFSFQKLWAVALNKPRRKNKKRPRNRTPINNNVRRKGQRPSTRNGKTGYRPGTTRVYDSPSRNDQDAPTFGGWDELIDQRRDFSMEPPMTSPRPSVGPSRTATEKGKLNRSGRENGAPLLLRLLIAVFPFLSSWTKML
nr:uncharacterized protein LOC109176136 isoform X1 [Ipomoea batatas]GMD48880.1 uncharacterized protein LOC109176136 isoform X1 [Ipomoea batatas]GMD74442.1 uncharacterized protein LOC109176136 isoform X1 [Ipomoea batatas]GME10238.1 uncharacterized protein LOC109176136 isoform X1 [Ipomoea batatas]